MERLQDLRFVIGLFFLIVGVLVVAASWSSPNAEEVSINRTYGMVYVVFGGLMYIFSRRG